MRKYIFISIIVLFFSCEKEVYIPIDQSKSKLVLNGLFSTDDFWSIELSTSKYIYDTSSILFINDADVIITNSSQTKINLSSQGNGIYTSTTNMPIKGETYAIEISHNDYENIKSTNQVPETPNIISMEWSEQETLGDDDLHRKINVLFQDSHDEEYYAISVKGSFWEKEKDWLTGKTDSSLQIDPLAFSTQNTAVESNNSKQYQRTILFSDDLFNGKQYTFDILISEDYFSYRNEIDDKDHFEGDYDRAFAETIYVSVSRISKEYYMYMKSYQAYHSQGGPFSQPVQVFTNIENGLGVFAGFSSVSDSLNVE